MALNTPYGKDLKRPTTSAPIRNDDGRWAQESKQNSDLFASTSKKRFNFYPAHFIKALLLCENLLIIFNEENIHPAATRNKDVILSELKKFVNVERPCKLLEISSGSGQHIAHISQSFPKMVFQPSEYDEYFFDSIIAYIKESPLNNICYPLKIDISQPLEQWNSMVNHKGPVLELAQLINKIDYILNINMIHITPFECTVGLFRNSSLLLKQNGILFTYGPYAENGILTPQSNIDFDHNLKQSNPLYGVRDIIHLKECAEEYGIRLINTINMPANNKFLIWEKFENHNFGVLKKLV